MTVAAEKFLTDPTLLTGLLRQIPFNQYFIWNQLVNVERINGTKWQSRVRNSRSVRAPMLDIGAHLPQGIKGTIVKRDGEMVKIGIGLPIDPEELIDLNSRGDVSAEFARIAESIATSIFSTYEWVTLRANFGQSIALEGGAAQTLGTLNFTDTTSTSWATAASATGIADLVAENDKIKLANQGLGSSRIIMSTQSWTYLRDMASTQELVYSTAGSGTQVNDQQIQNLLQANGLPPVQIYDGTVEVLDTTADYYTETRVVPADLVLFLPPVQRFPRGFGRIIEGVTSDQLIALKNGKIPSNLGGGIYGWVEEFTNPGRYECFGNVAAGWDLESIPYQGTLDTIP